MLLITYLWICHIKRICKFIKSRSRKLENQKNQSWHVIEEFKEERLRGQRYTKC